MTKFLSHLAVEISNPTNSNLKLYDHSVPSDLFNNHERFKAYTFNEDQEYIIKSHHGDYFYVINKEFNDYESLKIARQAKKKTAHHSSSALEVRLTELGLTMTEPSFDKAFAHNCLLVNQIDDISLYDQLKIANTDGDSDPVVTHSLHYIDNEYSNQTTRFVSGIETFSFATVTENEFYFYNIHSTNTALQYLMLFIYYKKYDLIPSHQMMPKLLANLWASTEIFNNHWNPHLLSIRSLNTK